MTQCVFKVSIVDLKLNEYNMCTQLTWTLGQYISFPVGVGDRGFLLYECILLC